SSITMQLLQMTPVRFGSLLRAPRCRACSRTCRLYPSPWSGPCRVLYGSPVRCSRVSQYLVVFLVPSFPCLCLFLIHSFHYTSFTMLSLQPLPFQPCCSRTSGPDFILDLAYG